MALLDILLLEMLSIIHGTATIIAMVMEVGVLVLMAVPMVTMGKIHSRAMAKALAIFKVVPMVEAEVVQVVHGLPHLETVVLEVCELSGVQTGHTQATQHKEYYGIY
jgi:hypothetical protein